MTSRFQSRLLALCAGLGLGLTALSSRPALACEDLQLSDGTVRSTPALAASAPSAADLSCADAIGDMLVGRSGVRSVTVAVRAGADARADGSAAAVAQQYVDRLVASGLPSARVSAVVPSVADGESASVGITVTLRRTGSPVAVIDAASGSVSAGPDPDALVAVAAGVGLPANQWVETGSDGAAMLGLADGSWVRLGANSALVVGDLRVNTELKRVVELEIVQGSVEAGAAKAGAGSTFEISGPTGVAGVRGTQFRVHAVGEESTRLETLEGAVMLTGNAGGEVLTPGGHGAAVGMDASPQAIRTLPASPRVRGPLEGPLDGESLRWRRVRGADSYLIELGRDAEFTQAVTVVTGDGGARELEPAVSDGKWFWRVAAVDSDGFIGPWSKVHAFEAGG